MTNKGAPVPQRKSAGRVLSFAALLACVFFLGSCVALIVLNFRSRHVGSTVVFHINGRDPVRIGKAAPPSVVDEATAWRYYETLLARPETIPDGKAYFVVFVTVRGEEPRIATSMLTFREDEYRGKVGLSGWNILSGRDTPGEKSRVFVSMHNGRRFDFRGDDVVHQSALLAEIHPRATEPSLSADELDALIAPYLDYLTLSLLTKK